MKRLIIIGAGGHGKVIADIAIRNGYTNIVFLDDDESLHECAGFPIIGKISLAKQFSDDKVVAIGKADIREKIQNTLETVTLIHPNATISRRVKIGKGSVIMAGAVINSDTRIGKGCIVNTGASIDHDCDIGDYTHISVGVHIAGTCRIGDKSFVGAGATIINNIDVCNNCTIGAGALVIKNIEESGTYIGVPAKLK